MAILLSSIGQPLVGGCSFYALNIPYPAAGRKGELLFIPRNLHNQIRQIGSRTTLNIPNSATYTRLAAGDTLAIPSTSAHIAGTQAGQIRARAAGVQDHRQQDARRECACYLVKVTLLQKVTQKKPAAGCREKQNKKRFLPAAHILAYLTP